MSSSSSDSISKHLASPYSKVIFETDKLIIVKDKHGVFGKVAPSKAAPDYLHDLIHKSHHNFVDDSCSTEESFDSSCSRNFEELLDWKKRIQDEERLSRMCKLRNTFSLRFDNRAWLHPHGATNFDYKGIAEEKKERVEKLKNRVRQENYKYLGNHPEIQAIISLAIKKMLSVLPEDPVKFLTEFFTANMTRQMEFDQAVEGELKKISKYHVSKMRAAGKVNIKASTEIRSEMSGESWKPEQDANHLKKMNIGALAQEFSFDASSMKVKKKKKSMDGKSQKRSKKSKKKQKTCGPTKYCGCKDWKLKKNQKLDEAHKVEEEQEEEEEEMPSTTFSTLGNINDNILTLSSVDDAEEEDLVVFGDGEFLGAIEEIPDPRNNLTSAEAKVIAGLLMKEVMAAAGVPK